MFLGHIGINHSYSFSKLRILKYTYDTLNDVLMKVGVIGGGIGGLYVTLKIIKYSDVELFEEHDVVGYPKHCTGLISEKVLNLIGNSTRNYVLNRFNKYTLIHDLRPNKHLELKFSSYVYLIDRPKIEEHLSDEVRDRGGVIHLGMKVTSVNPSEASIIINDSLRRNYDIVVNAEGAKARISRTYNLCSEVNYLLGLQAVVKCRNELDHPYVIFGSDVSREFFSWLVPIDDDHVIAGLADSSRDLYPKLMYVVRKYLIRRYWSGPTSFKEFFGGLIPMSTPCRQVVERLVGVGDAVSMTKPLSGGGIYAIAHQARMLEESFRGTSTIDEVIRRYERRVLKLTTNLKLQHILRKLLTMKFNSIGEFVGYVIDSGVNSITLADYDTYIVDVSRINDIFKLIKMLLLSII